MFHKYNNGFYFPHFIGLAGLWCLLCILVSCKKDESNLPYANGMWSPELFFPLTKANLTLKNIFLKDTDKGEVQVGPDGNMMLVYRSINESKKGNEIFAISNQLKQTAFTIPTSDINIFNNLEIGESLDLNLVSTHTLTLPFVGSQIDSIEFNFGNLLISLQSSIPFSCSVQFSSLDIQTSSGNFISDCALNPNATCTKTVFLNNSKLRVNSNGSFSIQLAIKITKTNGSIIQDGTHFLFKNEWKDLRFKRVYGLFPNLPILVPSIDTLFLRLYENVNGGELSFQNPSHRFLWKNSFGIDLSLPSIVFSGRSAQGQELAINTPMTFFPVQIPAGSLNVPGFHEVSVHSTLSNIQNVLIQSPRYLTSQGNYSLGSSNRHMFDFNSSLSLTSEIYLPLEGVVSNFSISDTLRLELNNLSKNIQNATIRLIHQNRYPVNINCQIYFCKQALSGS